MHLIDRADGGAACLPDGFDDLGGRIRHANDLGQATARNQPARRNLDRELLAGLHFSPFDNVAGHGDPAQPGSRRSRSGVASATRSRSQLRLKVFFARSRKSTPTSHPLKERPVALETPLPGFDDKTECRQRRKPVVPRGRVADLLPLAVLTHQIPGVGFAVVLHKPERQFLLFFELAKQRRRADVSVSPKLAGQENVATRA